jgi:cell shape-determining protein MreC
MSLFSTLKRQIPWDMTILTNHLIADVSRLSMAQIIPRIAIFLIALGLNRILPFPLVILFVTVLTILVVKWQTFGYMSNDGAVVDSALYFGYLIATTVGEWMQKKKLIRENRQLTQENGEVVQEKEQLVQYEEQLVQYGEQLVQYGEQLVQYGDH